MKWQQKKNGRERNKNEIIYLIKLETIHVCLPDAIQLASQPAQ